MANRCRETVSEVLVQVRGRSIGGRHPCFVIAEAGVNHDGDLQKARRLVRSAAEAGADAVKFQTFRAKDLVVEDAPKAAYQNGGTAPLGTQLDMLRALELRDEDYHVLVEEASRAGIVLLSSPFDEPSADLLKELGLPALKVASGELTNHRFLRYLAARGLPLFLSTGMSTMEEVEAAVSVIRSAGSPPLVLLHCVSSYPSPPEETNLKAMGMLRERFGVPVGFSDHTLGTKVALASVALGASVVEKHVTLDRKAAGPDHAASLEPQEFAEMVGGIRLVESALGNGEKVMMPSERDTARAARRSLVSARDIAAGSVLSEDDVAIRRPGTGLPPPRYEQTIGRRARSFIKEGTVLTGDLID